MKLLLNMLLLFFFCLSYESLAYTKPGIYSVNNTGLSLLSANSRSSKMDEFECQDCGKFMRVRIISTPVQPQPSRYKDEEVIAYMTSPAWRNEYHKFLKEFLQADKNTDYIIHTVRKGSIAGHNALKSVVTRKAQGSRAYTVHIWLTYSKGKMYGFGVLYFPGEFTGNSVTRFNQMFTSFKTL